MLFYIQIYLNLNVLNLNMNLSRDDSDDEESSKDHLEVVPSSDMKVIHTTWSTVLLIWKLDYTILSPTFNDHVQNIADQDFWLS